MRANIGITSPQRSGSHQLTNVEKDFPAARNFERGLLFVIHETVAESDAPPSRVASWRGHGSAWRGSSCQAVRERQATPFPFVSIWAGADLAPGSEAFSLLAFCRGFLLDHGVHRRMSVPLRTRRDSAAFGRVPASEGRFGKAAANG